MDRRGDGRQWNKKKRGRETGDRGKGTGKMEGGKAVRGTGGSKVRRWETFRYINLLLGDGTRDGKGEG